MKCYRSPAIAILLAEKGISEEIQLFRVGTFYHDVYGKFEITPDTLKTMEANYKAKVRGVDLAIDYKHDSDDVAAGWIKDVTLQNNGTELWAIVDWTPKGSKVLAEREFRYISPEFIFDYQDNETLKKFGPVLLGAGLTNRPTIKKMEPVVLSEEAPKEKGPISMDIKNVKPEDLDQMKPEDLLALCKQLLEAMNKPVEEKKPEEDAAAKEKAELADKQKMAELEQAKKCAEFRALVAEGKACKAQEQAFMSDDLVKFAALASSLKLNDGIGSGFTPAPVTTQKIESSEQAQDEVIKLAHEKIKANSKLDLNGAIRLVLTENKELNNKIYS